MRQLHSWQESRWSCRCTTYRPLPSYASSRSSNFSIGSILHLYSSVLSTNTLSLSHHCSSSTRVSSTSSGPVPSGPKKRATRSWPWDWLRSWPRDNNYYTMRRQCPRPAIPGSSFSSNTVLFPLLSSWANPSSYQDNPMNLTCSPRTNLQALGGSLPILCSSQTSLIPTSTPPWLPLMNPWRM